MEGTPWMELPPVFFETDGSNRHGWIPLDCCSCNIPSGSDTSLSSKLFCSQSPEVPSITSLAESRRLLSDFCLWRHRLSARKTNFSPSERPQPAQCFHFCTKLWCEIMHDHDETLLTYFLFPTRTDNNQINLYESLPLRQWTVIYTWVSENELIMRPFKWYVFGCGHWQKKRM